MSLISELKNRNVFRVAAAYIFGAWLVIQVIETIFPAFGFGDSAIRFVVIVFAIGLIPVLVFSWLFEITPEGLQREGDVDHSRPIALRTAKRLDRAIIVILTLAVGFFAFDKFVLNPVRVSEIERSTAERVRTETLVESYGDSSIAVLPFTNMSDDAGNEYFSDGMAEELLNLLARIPRLRVISQSSSFSFKGKGFTIPEVAEQLNVAFVLEGSVRKSGDRVRITAQLIEARSDTHLWSDTYDRTLDDVFAIQDEISAAIVDELKDHLKLDIGAAPKATGTTSTEAHDAELRGRYLLAQRKPGSRLRANAEFEKALALDPDYALAHAELAISLLVNPCGEINDNQCVVKAIPHVEKAMALEPGLAEAHAAKGFLSLQENQIEEGRAHFKRAIEINPSYAAVYVWMANSGLFSSLNEAFDARETAFRLDPLSPLTNYSYINALMWRNELAAASRQIEKYATIDPRGASILRGDLSSLGGHWANYIFAYLEAANGAPDDLNYSGAAADDMMWHLAMIGLEEEALRLADGASIRAESWLGNAEAGVAMARELLAEYPEEEFIVSEIAIALAHAGHYAEARPLLEERWQAYGRVIQGIAQMGWLVGPQAEALIAVLRHAGDDAGANQILSEFKDHLRSQREGGDVLTKWYTSLDYLQGIAAYLSGEHDTGLAQMSKAAEDGYWIHPPAAYQQAMYEDPQFVAILEKQKVRQAREREKVLALACADDYPYAAVWQPAAETCQRHLAVRQ
jgi:TolB-like protein/Tfp pilus assembly protein PilF